MQLLLKTNLIFILLLHSPICYAKGFITVAVIDSGIHLSHKALVEHEYINEGETGVDSHGRRKETNGIDDDKNGFVDDVSGWDFVENNNKPVDTNGHGTHISGIILGINTNNKKTESPIKIMSLKYYHAGANGQMNLLRSIAAMKYAIEMNVDVINYSGGGLAPDPREESLIRLAASKGIVIVSAAGNFGNNLQQEKFYPASYPSENLFAVGALNRYGRMLAESNYGRDLDFLAIGEDVVSSLPFERYGPMSGTSQATAVVTRRVALSLNTHPELKGNFKKLAETVSSQHVTQPELQAKAPLARLLPVQPVSATSEKLAQFFPPRIN